MEIDTEELSQIEIKITIADRINFASHQNDVAIISELIVRNGTDRMIENLELELIGVRFTSEQWPQTSSLLVHPQKIVISSNISRKLTPDGVCILFSTMEFCRLDPFLSFADTLAGMEQPPH